MTAPDDFTVEDFNPDDADHTALIDAGGVCATVNEGGESTADLSQVVPDGS